MAQADVGDLAEGIAFSPDGHYLYVGNFGDSDIDIPRLEGDNLTKVANFRCPGIGLRCAAARPEDSCA